MRASSRIMDTRSVRHPWCLLALMVLLLLPVNLVQCLRDVIVTIPTAVRRNENVQLICQYDMEGDSLYSVKWYKGRREFYRYTPKENPAMKTFNVGDIQVYRSRSNESVLTLNAVQMSVSGKYSCEVSADAPSFHTLIASGDLEVVEIPEHRPIIQGIRTRYRIGDSLRANCTSKHSRPAANLTWTINEMPANPLHVRPHRPTHDRHDLETSSSGIQFTITENHFVRGKLKIRCTSTIHDIYMQKTEKSIEQERLKPSLSSPTSNSINVIHTLPSGAGGSPDNDPYDKKDTYMTQIQGDMSANNAATARPTQMQLLSTLCISMLISIGLQASGAMLS